MARTAPGTAHRKGDPLVEIAGVLPSDEVAEKCVKNLIA